MVHGPNFKQKIRQNNYYLQQWLANLSVYWPYKGTVTPLQTGKADVNGSKEYFTPVLL
jgi:hypothetical protein